MDALETAFLRPLVAGNRASRLADGCLGVGWTALAKIALITIPYFTLIGG